jgi:dihydrofolate reductase
MAKVIYTAISSLDGYVADDEGNFEWSAPDDEVHRFVNDLERPIGTHLYGRRLYEVMRYWETAPTGDGELSAEQDYADLAGCRQDHLLHNVESRLPQGRASSTSSTSSN